MRDPFASYVRWTNSLVSESRNLFAPRLEICIDLIVLACFWWLVVLVFRFVSPLANIAQWIEEEWFFLVLGSLFLFTMYRFCRMFLDTKTGK